MHNLYLLVIRKNSARRAEGRERLLVLSQRQQSFRAAESRIKAANDACKCWESHVSQTCHLEYKLVCFPKKSLNLTVLLPFPFSLCQLLWIWVLNLLLILCVTSNLAFIKILLLASSHLQWEPWSHKRYGLLKGYQYELSQWALHANFSLFRTAAPCFCCQFWFAVKLLSSVWNYFNIKVYVSFSGTFINKPIFWSK